MFVEQIKKFTPEYFQSVCDLVRKLDDGLPLPTKDEFIELLESDNSYLFFIRDENSVAGMLTVGIYRSPTGSKAWIEDVVIDDKFRGSGLGKIIVQYAIEFIESKNIDSLMLTSNPTRIAANGLYRSLSFVRKETNVYRMQFKN